MQKYFSFLLIFISGIFSINAQVKKFVSVKDHHFYSAAKAYNYIGVNYWHAALLGTTAAGKIRLKKELDFLALKGVNNIRVLAVAEGTGNINGVPRVQPAYQPQKGKYNEELLNGLDYFLVEMSKRQMKAIIYLGNNWEWSGGFLQYLNWNGLIADTVVRRKLTWDENRDYVSKFYSCKPCIEQQAFVQKKIVNRVNSITKKKYKDDAAIMGWELANEPRPMRPAAIDDYKKWIASSASLIKSLDKNHLVTTGVEGDIGTENMDVFSAIHTNKNIDYATIHIWPKNWGWFKDTSIAKDMETIVQKTIEYIQRHSVALQQLNKPLVIEEFGLPRDEQSFKLTAATSSRDAYYATIFEQLLKSVKAGDVLQGVNFWGFSGMGRPSYKQLLWAKGDDMLGDPPVEEQGLNSVFDTDKSTWQIIQSYILKLKN